MRIKTRTLFPPQDEGIPIVSIFLEKVELPRALRLTLSDRQALLQYELDDSVYEKNCQLYSRMKLYFLIKISLLRKPSLLIREQNVNLATRNLASSDGIGGHRLF